MMVHIRARFPVAGKQTFTHWLFGHSWAVPRIRIGTVNADPNPSPSQAPVVSGSRGLKRKQFYLNMFISVNLPHMRVKISTNKNNNKML